MQVTLSDWRRFLKSQGLTQVTCGKGGHEKWTKEGIIRPIIFSNHGGKEIPLGIINSNLKSLEISYAEFLEITEAKKYVDVSEIRSKIKPTPIFIVTYFTDGKTPLTVEVECHKPEVSTVFYETYGYDLQIIDIKKKQI